MKLLLLVLLFGHLISMQLAGAGPLVSAWLEYRGHAKGLPTTVEEARRLAWHSIYGLIGGMGLGLLLVWAATQFGSRDYLPVVSKFYSRVWWGGWELVTSLVVMLIYVLCWSKLCSSRGGRIFLRFLALFSATNLLYHFPPLMTVMVESMESAAESGTPVDPAFIVELTSSEFRQLIFRTEVFAKSLHFGLAGFAASGAYLMWSGKTVGDDAGETETNARSFSHAVRWGSWITVVAIAIQLLVGMWLVVLSPPSIQSQLMGKNPWVAGALIGGILLSLAAMNQAAGVGMGDTESAKPRLAALTVVAVIGLMVMVTGLTGSW
ncbi:MAG: hypothetical protein AAF497_21070 [Planctomycetota bacterium]